MYITSHLPSQHTHTYTYIYIHIHTYIYIDISTSTSTYYMHILVYLYCMHHLSLFYIITHKSTSCFAFVNQLSTFSPFNVHTL